MGIEEGNVRYGPEYQEPPRQSQTETTEPTEEGQDNSSGLNHVSKILTQVATELGFAVSSEPHYEVEDDPSSDILFSINTYAYGPIEGRVSPDASVVLQIDTESSDYKGLLRSHVNALIAMAEYFHGISPDATVEIKNKNDEVIKLPDSQIKQEIDDDLPLRPPEQKAAYVDGDKVSRGLPE